MNDAAPLPPAPPGPVDDTPASAAAPAPLPARIRRTLELVYGVEGVTGARVWHSPGQVSVGVRPAMLSAQGELLHRVERAIAGLREPDETWDFGLLDSD